MSKGELLQETEAWWCRECKRVVDFNPGESMGLSCFCDGFMRDIADIPDNWVECKIVVYDTKIDLL